MKPRKLISLFAALMAVSAASGCQNQVDAKMTTPPQAESPNLSKGDSKALETNARAAEEAAGVQPAEPVQVGAKPKAGDQVAVLETDEGRIVLRFFDGKAPNHVKNFIDLSKKGFYDGTKFHRTMPGFMIQGGDPNTKSGDPATWGQGGPEGVRVKAEFNDVPHKRGILSMARSQDPDSAGSQFFIVVKDSNFLDGQYTAFGEVVEGLDTADRIVARPSEQGSGRALKPVTLKKVTIQTWPLKK